jgi:hypothetical protein
VAYGRLILFLHILRLPLSITAFDDHNDTSVILLKVEFNIHTYNILTYKECRWNTIDIVKQLYHQYEKNILVTKFKKIFW